MAKKKNQTQVDKDLKNLAPLTNDEIQIKRMVIYGTKIVLGFMVFLLFLGSFYTIQAGTQGVLLTLGEAQETQIGEGFHLKVPIAQKVIKMDIQAQKVQAKASAATKDKQIVTTNMAINYYLDPSSTVNIYRTVGLAYETKLIAPALLAETKAATAKFTSMELLQNRQQVEGKILEGLISRLTKRGIIVTDVYVENFEFSPEYNAAIEISALAEQRRIKATNDLATIKVEAEQEVTAAQGEADAKVARAEATAKEITLLADANAHKKEVLAEAEAKALGLQRKEIDPNILQLRKIEVEMARAQQWDGSVPKFTMSSGQGMFWQMPKQIFEDTQVQGPEPAPQQVEGQRVETVRR